VPLGHGGLSAQIYDCQDQIRFVQKLKNKNHVYKNKREEPIHQKYKANENTSKHNPKKKQKQTSTKIR
jgi:hypothetical protein